MTLSKRHVQRLQVMLKERESREAELQKRYGDRHAGSLRSIEWHEANALRAVLALVVPQQDGTR